MAPPTPRAPRRCPLRALGPAAFTLIELLVVISIVAVLMGVLLPALGSAKGAARVVRELADARSLMQGYTAYAHDHRDYLLPAQIKPGLGPEILHDTPRDHMGNPVTGQPAVRFFWRLAPYLDYQLGAFFRDEQFLDDTFSRISQNTGPLEPGSSAYNDYYSLTVYPAFGLNSRFVGGTPDYYKENTIRNRNRYTNAGATGWWIKSLYEPPDPASLFTFVSSAQVFQDQFFEGYFEVLPPRFSSNSSPADRWQEYGSPTRPGASPERFGHVWPVHQVTVVTGLLDGHAEALDWNAVQDMRAWAPLADHPDWEVDLNVQIPNSRR